MKTMNNSAPEHEKLFDEICNRLNELSTQDLPEELPPVQPKYEQMQVQMKKFQSELKGSQEELLEKIKSFENVSFGPETLDAQIKHLADQLGLERANNTKLSADLAKSLELSLQLQLEIQGLKARTLQIQSEEKKYSQAVLEKNKALQRDLELMHALKEETVAEFIKAKNVFSNEQQLWEQQRQQFESQIQNLRTDNSTLHENIVDLHNKIDERDKSILSLNEEIEKISTAYSEVEQSALQQTDALKNLMSIAETKIVEMKIALDKKALEAQDYFSHLQQALTQLGVLKQENAALKEYVAKLNYYHQQAQMAVGQMIQPQQSSSAVQTAPAN